MHTHMLVYEIIHEKSTYWRVIQLIHSKAKCTCTHTPHTHTHTWHTHTPHDTHTHTHTHMHTHTFTHTLTHAHTYTHTHSRTHTHTKIKCTSRGRLMGLTACYKPAAWLPKELVQRLIFYRSADLFSHLHIIIKVEKRNKGRIKVFNSHRSCVWHSHRSLLSVKSTCVTSTEH